jgi:predicted aldo/keto reductase-like oxidoreductase
LSNIEQWQRLQALGIEEWIAAKKFKREIRQIGFSFHGTEDSFLQLLDSYDWDICQIQYNYMNENYQAGRKGLQAAAARGLPVVIMEPLLGGKLASSLPKRAAAVFAQADPNRSAAAWALLWLWDQPQVSVVLSGMNSPEQLTNNVASANEAKPGMLGPAQEEVFRPVREAFEQSYKVPCTGCAYCMPCPRGVNIPGCLAAYNISYVTGFISGMTQYITSTGSLDASARTGAPNCIGCKVCEQKCPQQIAIAKTLQDVRKRFEPWWFALVLKIASRFR